MPDSPISNPRLAASYIHFRARRDRPTLLSKTISQQPGNLTQVIVARLPPQLIQVRIFLISSAIGSHRAFGGS
jgi:hypothetical protein